MLRALVSIIVLLATLLALAKFAVVPQHARRLTDPPYDATWDDPSLGATHSSGNGRMNNGVQHAAHNEVIFDDSAEPAARVAGRPPRRRPTPTTRSNKSGTRSSANNHSQRTPQPPGDKSAANPNQSGPPLKPTPTSTDGSRGDIQGEPTPSASPTVAAPTPGATAITGESTQQYLENLSTPPTTVPPPEEREPETAENANGNLPPATAAETLNDVVPEQVETEEGLGETGGLPPGVDPWYQPPANWTRVMAERRDRIRQCLDFYYTQPLNSRDHSPWSIMHTMIAWGTDSQIAVGGPKGERVSAIRWLCSNGVSDGVQMLFVKNGVLGARVGPGLQGHDAQFLALLAQTRVHRDYPIRVDNQNFMVNDLIEQEKLGCKSGNELTFQLIGLSHYLDTDAQWKNKQGQTWDFPRLIREERSQPINGVTCGGTHRLMGMNYAVRRREYQGKEITGEWAQARAFATRYQNLAFSMQNRDGSFSTNFFRSRGDWGGIDRKLKTTGHILEWLIFSLPHDQLQDVRVTRAVDMLTNMLMQNRYYEWEKGPIGHAIRALSLYDERVFGGRPGQRAGDLARRATPQRTPSR